MINPRDHMAGTPSPGASVKAEDIQGFNHTVNTTMNYKDRKEGKTSTTVFFDCKDSSTLPCKKSPRGWCTITNDLEDWLTTSTGSNQLTRFQNFKKALRRRRHAEREPSTAESSSYLKLTMGYYLQRYKELAESYDAYQKLIVLSEVVALKHELKETLTAGSASHT